MPVFRAIVEGYRIPEDKYGETVENLLAAGFEGLSADIAKRWMSSERFVDASDLEALAEFGDIVQYKPISLMKFYRKVERLTAGNLPQAINTTQITLETSKLHNVKRVEVLNEGCTIELQKMLCDGWFILAICPQDNQRRPDYVLGRVDL